MTEQFSERELEILRLMAEGQSNREIADRLIVSPETVKWYNKQIFARLGSANRGQAVARAREMGLLDGPDTAGQPASGHKRLPSQLTSFIGRRREVAEVADLLGRARLVTVTGPGGTGKTRLSLQVASAVTGHFAHGVVFVSLAALNDPEGVAKTVARELGLADQPGVAPAAALQRYLANKELLLLLDNFEHLLPASPLVIDLLAAAPRLAVLATSRERLRLSGEYEYPLPPLGLPGPGQALTAAGLAEVEAAALFEQRAQAAVPSFRLTDDNAPDVAAICRRLDGLPLAIELAAARSKLFNPRQLLARLDSRLEMLTGGPRDAPARQRTLHDTINWSYQLLDRAEQRLFTRLAVFVGGRSIGAVAAVAAPELEPDVLDGLASLLDKNLLYQEEGPGHEPRFYMLETIHEFAWLRLRESGEEKATRDRHLAYFLTLVEDMAPGYRGHNQRLLLARTAAEKYNLRAAFDWAVACRRFDEAARLLSGLHYFLFYEDSSVEGYQWFRQALAFQDQLSPPVKTRLLLAAGRLAWVNGEQEHAVALGQVALEQAQALGEPRLLAWALAEAAGMDDRPELFASNIKQTSRALALFRALGDRAGEAYVLNLEGELFRAAGDLAQARDKYEQSFAVCVETGERFRQDMLRVNLSMLDYDEGDFRRSLERSRDGLRGFMATGNRQGMVAGLWQVAGPLAQLGHPVEAARLLAATLVLFDEIGAREHPTDLPQLAKYEADVRQILGPSAFVAALAEGRAMSFDQALACALVE